MLTNTRCLIQNSTNNDRSEHKTNRNIRWSGQITSFPLPVPPACCHRFLLSIYLNKTHRHNFNWIILLLLYSSSSFSSFFSFSCPHHIYWNNRACLKAHILHNRSTAICEYVCMCVFFLNNKYNNTQTHTHAIEEMEMIQINICKSISLIIWNY